MVYVAGKLRKPTEIKIKTNNYKDQQVILYRTQCKTNRNLEFKVWESSYNYNSRKTLVAWYGLATTTIVGRLVARYGLATTTIVGRLW